MRFQLTKITYYADFALAPLAALALLIIEPNLPAAAAGFVAWTLAEYLIHRFVFHRGPLKANHNDHHRMPAAYIGVAPYGTALAALALWTALRATGAPASAVTAGVALGYLAYMVIHDRMHHTSPAHYGRYVAWMAALHNGHHRGGRWNFGVTSPLWDRVLGTYKAA